MTSSFYGTHKQTDTNLSHTETLAAHTAWLAMLTQILVKPEIAAHDEVDQFQMGSSMVPDMYAATGCELAVQSDANTPPVPM